MVDFDLTFVYEIINFGVLVVLLTVFLYKPIKKNMEARQNEIRATLDKIEADREEARKFRDESLASIEKAKKDAEVILERTAKQSETLKDEMVNDAKKQAEQIVSEARTTIELEKKNALTQLRQEVANLTILAASKVIGEKLDSESHQKLIMQSIEEVGK